MDSARCSFPWNSALNYSVRRRAKQLEMAKSAGQVGIVDRARVRTGTQICGKKDKFSRKLEKRKNRVHLGAKQNFP